VLSPEPGFRGAEPRARPALSPEPGFRGAEPGFRGAEPGFRGAEPGFRQMSLTRALVSRILSVVPREGHLSGFEVGGTLGGRSRPPDAVTTARLSDI
jgi:hypothetical protein